MLKLIGSEQSFVKTNLMKLRWLEEDVTFFLDEAELVGTAPLCPATPELSDLFSGRRLRL